MEYGLDSGSRTTMKLVSVKHTHILSHYAHVQNSILNNVGVWNWNFIGKHVYNAIQNQQKFCVYSELRELIWKNDAKIS